MSEPTATRETHTATANVVDLLRSIVELGGGTTAALATATGIHRDTARRVLVELEAQGWVSQVDLRNQRGVAVTTEITWQLDVGMQQLALGWMDQQAERIAAIQEQVQRAGRAAGWQVVDGQRRWLPLTTDGSRA